jgi:hypothetical protein
MDFYIEFFDLLGEDLLKVVEEVRISGTMPLSFNSTLLLSYQKWFYLIILMALGISYYATAFTKLFPRSL